MVKSSLRPSDTMTTEAYRPADAVDPGRSSGTRIISGSAPPAQRSARDAEDLCQPLERLEEAVIIQSNRRGNTHERDQVLTGDAQLLSQPSKGLEKAVHITLTATEYS